MDRRIGTLVGPVAMLLLLAATSGCGGSSPFAAESDLRNKAVLIVPQELTAAPGGSYRFQAMGMVRDRMVDITSNVDWSATGGTIDQNGVYRAGSQTGEFKVRARRANHESTARVTISSSAPPPPSDDDPPADDPDSGPGDTPDVDGVRVTPGQSIQALVDRNPAGTTFILASGRHVKQSVRPRDGNRFIGEAGAVMDGGGAVQYAFDGRKGQSNVLIRNLVIENYAPPPQDGAVMGKGSQGWTVEDNEIRYNIANVRHQGCARDAGCGGMGVKIGDRMVVRNNHLHHNDEYGVGGSGDNVLVEGNEIAFNNYRDAVRVGFGAGGTKFVGTRSLIVRNNYVHDNHGNGIWTDIKNLGVLVEGNRVFDNDRQGIFHEISYSAVIRNNTVRGNGFGEKSDWLYGAGILIAHSSDVEVYGNVVEDNWNGIVGIQQDRDNYYLKNLWVHDNTVKMSRGGSGVGETGSGNDPFTSASNNRFDRNDYRVSSSEGKPFRWRGSETWTGWRNAGQDPQGSYTNGI
jgi:parallel beta-helix repeat protein